MNLLKSTNFVFPSSVSEANPLNEPHALSNAFRVRFSFFRRESFVGRHLIARSFQAAYLALKK